MEAVSDDRTRVIHLVDSRPSGTRPAFATTAQNFVAVREDGRTVLKYPNGTHPNGLHALCQEADRYRHLGPHDNVVAFKEMCRDGLVLEYCERRSLYAVLFDNLTDSQKISIAKQVTRGLIHLHQHDYIHCDLNVYNVFVTANMVAKIGDLQGQLYNPDGTIAMEAMVEENVKSRHPQAGKDEFSPKTDIFALGTLLYHIWYGHEVLPDLSQHIPEEQEEIQAKFRRGEYPIDEVSAIGMDRIISRCWHSSYKTAKAALDDMNKLDQDKPDQEEPDQEEPDQEEPDQEKSD